MNTSSGKKYYYNVKTKESTWSMPDELKKIVEKMVRILY